MHLRAEDRQELTACYGLPARAGLEVCAQLSAAAVAFVYRGEVCAAAGVEAQSLLGRRGCVWSWTGEGVLHCPKAFWRASRAVLRYFHSLYPQLYAVCDVQYRAARRYVQRLGGVETGRTQLRSGAKNSFVVYRFENGELS